MISSTQSLRGAAVVAVLLLSVGTAAAQQANNQFKGYLGVYVVPAEGGMRISNFIRNTPAEMLSLQGDIARNHTIFKLGGLPTRSLNELRMARDRIPEGQEAKMLVRGPDGVYHVWISRNEGGGGFATEYYPDGKYGSPAGSANPGSAAPGSGKPSGDFFYKGGVGEGEDDNFRAKGSAAEPKAGAPAKSPAPAGDGDFRPKQ